MGRLDDILWKISPMGQVEALLTAAFDIVDDVASGRLPEARNLIKLAGADADGAESIDSSPSCDPEEKQ